jgi:trans-aconitate methyltransferase
MEQHPEATDGPNDVVVTGDWRDEEFVRRWQQKDADVTDRLDFPRELTASVVATGPKPPWLMIDVGSGPGTYLAVLLDAFPKARGVWVDSSEPMLEIARVRLASYAGRVDYEVADMRELRSIGLPPADVLVTSRAAHHLTYEALVDFYRAGFDQLVSGGWIANLDHTEPAGTWEDRYKQIRKLQRVPRPHSDDLPKHRHDHPRPTAAENISALTTAGFEDVELVWKAFHTCLFMARKP